MAEKDRLEEEAWVGDAVLGLFVRKWILQEKGEMDGELYGRLTSNAYLSLLGNPTEVEAEIGRLFEAQGLQKTFDHLAKATLPVLLGKEAETQHSMAQRAEAKAKRSKRTRWKKP